MPAVEPGRRPADVRSWPRYKEGIRCVSGRDHRSGSCLFHWDDSRGIQTADVCF